MIFEKVNPAHPDKVADRIAGAILDLSNKLNDKFIAAVEVLIGHDKCLIINETNTVLNKKDVDNIVKRIAGDIKNIEYLEVAQDIHLNENQQGGSEKTGDNGIFVGIKTNETEQLLADLAGILYNYYGTDGKYLINDIEKRLVICQSNAENEELSKIVYDFLIKNKKNYAVQINPLGYWKGGTNVDTGATNRKLGSDMGRAVTGGGLHGKDLSKADLSVNVGCHILAEKHFDKLTASCFIGSDNVYINEFKDFEKFYSFKNLTKKYIEELGGYEKFAEWGIIRPKNNKKIWDKIVNLTKHSV